MLNKLIELLWRLFGRHDPAPAPVCRTSAEGIKLIKHYEGVKLKAYQDAVGVWTIGYGDTGPHVNPGDKITQEEADRRLALRLRDEFEPGVFRALRVNPSQPEFDAMVSLAYNIGVHAFSNSTLVKKFNAMDTMGAANEFPRWDKAGGRSLKGLRRRRASERARFLGMSADAAIAEGAQVE